MLLIVLVLVPYAVGHRGGKAGNLAHSETNAVAPHAVYLPVVISRAWTTPCATSTPTPTEVLPTLTPSPTATASPSPSATPSPTCTHTPTATCTPSPTPTWAPLTIGHITDAHIGFAWLESQRLPLVVSTLTQEADVMVDTGDCTEHGTEDEYGAYRRLVNSNATIPWRAVPGPHDDLHTFETFIGPLEWSWDVGGYRLIGINTEAIDYGVLDRALTPEKPCIIFGHFPLDYCSPVDREMLRQRFLEYDIPIYVAGHAHLNSLTVDPYSGTLLLVGQRTVRCHYRLIRLHGFDVPSVDFQLACH